MFNFAQIRWEKKVASIGGLFHFKLRSLVGTSPTCQLHQAMSALFVLSNLRFVTQHGVQKRTMNLDFSVVIDKAPFSKFVHEEADP
jgi:hypothetical protein